MEIQSTINSVGLVVFAASLTFMASAFWNRRNRRELEDKIKKDAEAAVGARLTELENKLAILNQAVVPISAAFQAILIKELTHFHTPELDGYLSKVGPPSRLTLVEEERMLLLLDERAKELNGDIPESERDAAVMLPMVMKRAKLEVDALVVDVQVVALPATLGDETLPSSSEN